MAVASLFRILDALTKVVAVSKPPIQIPIHSLSLGDPIHGHIQAQLAAGVQVLQHGPNVVGELKPHRITVPAGKVNHGQHDADAAARVGHAGVP